MLAAPVSLLKAGAASGFALKGLHLKATCDLSLSSGRRSMLNMYTLTTRSFSQIQFQSATRDGSVKKRGLMLSPRTRRRKCLLSPHLLHRRFHGMRYFVGSPGKRGGSRDKGQGGRPQGPTLQPSHHPRPYAISHKGAFDSTSGCSGARIARG